MAKKSQIPTLDLHGFKRDEVWDAMDKFLRKFADSVPRVRVMTGKGQGIVRQEAENYLKQARYHFSVERTESGALNEGVLLVFMD